MQKIANYKIYIIITSLSKSNKNKQIFKIINKNNKKVKNKVRKIVNIHQ